MHRDEERNSFYTQNKLLRYVDNKIQQRNTNNQEKYDIHYEIK